jgi:hypothetical protein
MRTLPTARPLLAVAQFSWSDMVYSSVKEYDEHALRPRRTRNHVGFRRVAVMKRFARELG